MFLIGPFIDFLTLQTGLTIIQPSSSLRPPLPYATVVDILSNQGGRQERGRAMNGDDEEIYKARHSQFSVTAIGALNTTDAQVRAQELFDLLDAQVTIDWLDARNLALRIANQPHARYLIEDNFNEKRYGFDIEIRDTHITKNINKGLIETLTATDTGGKVKTITVLQES